MGSDIASRMSLWSECEWIHLWPSTVFQSTCKAASSLAESKKLHITLTPAGKEQQEPPVISNVAMTVYVLIKYRSCSSFWASWDRLGSDSYYLGKFLECVFAIFFLIDSVQFFDRPLLAVFYCLLGFSLANARKTMLINRIWLCGKPLEIALAEMILFHLIILKVKYNISQIVAFGGYVKRCVGCFHLY